MDIIIIITLALASLAAFYLWRSGVKRANADAAVAAELAAIEVRASGKEIEPPWIKYPDHLPDDPYWKEQGKRWMRMVWEPYWESLDTQSQDHYLRRWGVPAEWQLQYFDPEMREWLASFDDPAEAN